jgi:uncharacterized UBP type Zn finger protein
MTATECTHLDTIEITELPEEVAGCEECLAAGGQWCHLRICLACGHIGCCDSSPGRHATAHSRDCGHPIVRSVQPGENWGWCYEDQLLMPVSMVQGEPRIPPSPLCP